MKIIISIIYLFPTISILYNCNNKEEISQKSVIDVIDNDKNTKEKIDFNEFEVNKLLGNWIDSVSFNYSGYVLYYQIVKLNNDYILNVLSENRKLNTFTKNKINIITENNTLEIYNRNNEKTSYNLIKVQKNKVEYENKDKEFPTKIDIEILNNKQFQINNIGFKNGKLHNIKYQFNKNK